MSTVKPSASGFIVGALTRMAGQANLRRWLAGKLEGQIHKALVDEDSQNLKSVQEKKCAFVGAMLDSAVRNMENGRISRRVINRLIEVLVKNCLLGETGVRRDQIRAFEEKYEQIPPAFIVLSPTQKCNLNCSGCYAGSTTKTAATLPYDVVDRIVGEAHDIFGSRFVTIRESVTEPPNYFIREEGSEELTQITNFPHPTPQLKDVQKELIKYKRDDGVDLSATLYLPSGYKKEDGSSLDQCFGQFGISWVFQVLQFFYPELY